MINPTTNLKIDVNKSANYETITVKQGDINSRTYKITLVSNGQIVTLATTDSVKAKAERGGETVAFITCTKSGNEILMTLSPAMLAVAGPLKVEFMVYSSSGAKLTSATQIFKVDRSIPESPIVSTPDFSALDDMVKRAEAAILAGTVDGELKDARGGEKALRDRLDKIESGQRIAQGAITNEHLAYDAVGTEEIINGAVTLEKMSGEAKEAFAEKNHNHSGAYIPNMDGAITPALLSAAAKALFAAANHNHNGAYVPNTDGAVTPALLSAAAKALFAPLEYAGAAKFLPEDITVRSGSLKGTVNTAAIQGGAVTTSKMADGAVTEEKVNADFIYKYGHYPYTEITSYGDSAEIPYDDYTINGIYRFTGRYIPIVLFVIEGNTSYTTQIRMQGDEIQTRAYIANGWTEWGGGKAQLADSLEQFANQIKQLQNGAEKQVQTEKIADYAVTGKKLGYYSVSREKIAPEAVNEEKISGGAITPQKFAKETKSIFANALLGYAYGDIARIADGIPDTLLTSAAVRGRSAVNEATGTITPLSPSVIVASSNDGTVENHVNLPEGLQLYSTPNDQYYDTYDAITGVLTRNCTVFAMSSGFIYGYSQSAESIVWITDPLFTGGKSYYLVKDGTVTSSTTDWQGKIQIVIPKTDAGITSTDTSAQAREKMLAYWGSAYAILPLKTPSVEQYEGVQLALPTKECAVVCNNAYMDVTYCRDINATWKELTDYASDLQRHIALLEAKG